LDWTAGADSQEETRLDYFKSDWGKSLSVEGGDGAFTLLLYSKDESLIGYLEKFKVAGSDAAIDERRGNYFMCGNKESLTIKGLWVS
jgi:hypothetical protein